MDLEKRAETTMAAQIRPILCISARILLLSWGSGLQVLRPSGSTGQNWSDAVQAVSNSAFQLTDLLLQQ